MRRLIIARHGNTFLPDETPRRVGRKSDLPLVEEARSRNAGRYLKSQGLIPDRVLAAPLKRTVRTAQCILDELGIAREIIPADAFLEIDYGPDENKTEADVYARLGREYLQFETGHDADSFSSETIAERGKAAVFLWNVFAIPPKGWKVDVSGLIDAWHTLAEDIGENETVLLVSSNGVIRFSPRLLGDRYKAFEQEHSLKVTTGGLCLFEKNNGEWESRFWNRKPAEVE